ncbi:outer membrane beta-barrel protein [Ferrimonas pelagia]|uniref:Exopolysaccharide biosynthesis beta-barrel protein VpsM n=1 Tax=Ferrimonas pelagia TaxID=1177826 RepID=A0ABP9EZG7_9GAMM
MRQVFGICLWLLATFVSASEFEPAKIELKERLFFRPTLELELGHDDNLLNTGGDSLSSSFMRVSPDLWLTWGRRISHIRTHYQLDATSYFDSSADNYVDHLFDVIGHHEFTARHRIDGEYQYQRGHEERGTGLAEFVVLAEPIEYSKHRVELGYGFGAEAAKMQIGVKLGFEDRKYENFRRDLTEYRDYDDVSYGADVSWRLGQRTSLLFDGRYSDRRYDRINPLGSSRDSSTLRFLTGVSWEASGKTEGRVTFGLEEKNFDDGNREDFSGFSWDVGVIWRPRSYSTVELSSARAAKDPFTAGDYVAESVYQLGWTHYWRERIATQLDYRFENDDYTGVSREDDIHSVHFGVIYEFRRWLKFEPYIHYYDRSSSRALDAINYDKSRFGLLATIAM